MTTFKQIRAIEKLVENGGNVTKAMRDVGYSDGTVNNPSNLTRSKGYREILADTGLTETFIVEKLVSDIQEKPARRLGELTLAADLLGLRKKGLIIEDGKTQNERDEKNESIAREQSMVFEEYLKAKLAGRSTAVITVV